MPRIRPGYPVDYGTGHILFAGETAGFLNPLMVCEAYRKRTEKLKSYIQRKWSLVGRMAGTFREMS